MTEQINQVNKMNFTKHELNTLQFNLGRYADFFQYLDMKGFREMLTDIFLENNRPINFDQQCTDLAKDLGTITSLLSLKIFQINQIWVIVRRLPDLYTMAGYLLIPKELHSNEEFMNNLRDSSEMEINYEKPAPGFLEGSAINFLKHVNPNYDNQVIIGFDCSHNDQFTYYPDLTCYDEKTKDAHYVSRAEVVEILKEMTKLVSEQLQKTA